MISTFLLQLGAGCIFGALPVPAAATGRAFNRFVAGLAGTLLLLGIGVTLAGGGVRPTTRALWGLAAVAAVAASALAHLGRVEQARLPLLLAAACSFPALAIDAAALARAVGPGDATSTVRYALDAVSSAWVLGAVLVAMILGHYYLNIAGLAIAHLVRLCLLAMAAVALRAAIALWGFADGGADLLRPLLGLDAANVDLLATVVVLQRVLFGIAGAAVLTHMAWRTARIQSTQSATGILYIAFIAVLVGELASRYLLFGMGRPI